MSDRFDGNQVQTDSPFPGKITLFDNDDFRYFLTLKPIPGLVGGHSLTITSQWDSSSRPTEELVRFRACLDRQGLERLQGLIHQELAS